MTQDKPFCSVPVMERNTYGQRLKKARELSGLSQSALAREVGVKPQAIQYLESPNQNAQDSRHTVALAQVLRVRAEWLATGKGPMRLDDIDQLKEPTEKELNAIWAAYPKALKCRIVEMVAAARSNPRDRPSTVDAARAARTSRKRQQGHKEKKDHGG